MSGSGLGLYQPWDLRAPRGSPGSIPHPPLSLVPSGLTPDSRCSLHTAPRPAPALPWGPDTRPGLRALARLSTHSRVSSLEPPKPPRSGPRHTPIFTARHPQRDFSLPAPGSPAACCARGAGEGRCRQGGRGQLGPWLQGWGAELPTGKGGREQGQCPGAPGGRRLCLGVRKLRAPALDNLSSEEVGFGLQTLSITSQRANIFGFVDHTASVTATPFCRCHTKATTDNV